VADPANAPGKRTISWRLVVFGALAVYAILLVVLNARQVSVNFVLFSTQASLVVVLLLAIALGFLAGFLFDTLRERRRRTPSS
jgi:uncharacterized integral membrane protein